jgi:hypothetical protein
MREKGIVTTMKKSWILAITAIFSVCLMTLAAAAQTSASGSATGNASVTPGQASAGASASQSAQTPGGSANTGASANATASHQHESKTQDKDSGAKNSSSKKSDNKSSNGGAEPNTSAVLSSGTSLQAELAKSVDCKKAKPGDEVTAKLTQDVKSDGKVVLHKGSRLVGHVTEAQAKSKDNAESKLGIVFDKAVMKGGQEVAFNGAVQALAPPVQGSLSAAGAESADIAGAGMPRGGNMGGARSTAPLGGAVGSTVGAATSTVGNTAGSVTGAAGGAVNSTAGTAVNGTINSTSRGVVGMEGLTMNTAAAGSAQGSVITSATRNVKLDAGTQMVLQVVGGR